MSIKIPVAIALALSYLPAFADTDTKVSEFRPHLNVEFIYTQELGEPYSTTWYARLEKSTGKKRTVYIETSEKFVNKGFITFDCSNPRADVKLTLYHWGELNGNDYENITVRAKDFKAWNNESFEPLQGESPPYTLYRKLRTKYCR